MSTEEQLFAVKDFDTVEAEALAIYETETGVALAPADPRRLHLRAFLLFAWQQRGLIDFAGKQSILRTVSDVWIDDLADWLDATRLPAQPATTTLRVTMSVAGPHLIASGKRASGGGYLWSMPQIAIPIGETSADVLGTCTTLGSEANDLSPGSITEMADTVPFLQSVTNITKTAGGTPAESLEAFRERLRTAPDAWSVAGPREAYESLARAVSPLIIDVRALALRDNAEIAGVAIMPGYVRIMVLALGGASPELLAAVEAALSADEVCPLTDHLDVTTAEHEGTAVDLVIAGTYYIAQSRSGEATAIQAAVAAAFQEYLSWQCAEFGRDVNPDELRARALAAGAKRLDLGAFAFAALAPDEVAVIPGTVVDLAKFATCVGDGVVTVVPHAAGGIPAPGDYWVVCKSLAAPGVDPVFLVFRVDPPGGPLLSAEVDADGALHTVLGLDVTITVGGVPWAVFDLWTFTVDPGPTLAYGGLEDD